MKQPLNNTNLRRILSVLLITVSILWIMRILYIDKSSLAVITNRIGWDRVPSILLSIGFGCLSQFFLLAMLREMITYNSKVKLPLPFLSSVFFCSQLAKYIPGKIFPFVFQVNEIKDRIPAALLLKANAELIIFSFISNFLMAGAIIFLYKFNFTVGLFLLIIILLFSPLVFLKLNVITPLFNFVKRMVPKSFTAISAIEPINQKVSSRSIVISTASFVMSSLCYLSAWISLGNVFDGNTILLCAHYTIAYIVGMLFVVIPLGIGVREAFFIFLSSPLDNPATLVFISVFMRF